MTPPANEPPAPELGRIPEPDPAPRPEPAAERAFDPGAMWYDDDAGPMVRLYTVTRGRTRPVGDEEFDLITLVVADEGTGTGSSPEADLDDEHCALLDHCRAGPISVADLAAAANLPVGVVRVLLGDLVDTGHVRASRPMPPAELPDTGVLRDVISGLRAL